MINIFRRTIYKTLMILLVLGSLMTFVSSVSASDSNIILFWGDGCPHCAVLKDEISENGYDKKITIDYKEIYSNKDNAKLFDEKIKECGISPYNAGVPMVYANGYCWLGQDEAIYAIEKKIGEIEGNAEFTSEENNESDLKDIEEEENSEKNQNDYEISEESTDQISESPEKKITPVVNIIGGLTLSLTVILLIIILYKLFIKSKHED